MTESGTTLVLFDIDGTLVRTAHAGLRSLNAVFGALHGRADAADGVPFAGRTDRAILRDVFLKMGVPWEDAGIREVQDAYFSRLADELDAPPPGGGEGFGVLPGVEALLESLGASDGCSVGLLTGNFERGARIKLERFDLWSWFAFGAFGDEHLDRRALVPVARARAREAGLEPGAVVVIGDTPLDVDCAQAHGAASVAVATGNYTVADLAGTGPDLVVETLADVDVRKITRLAAASAR